MTPLELAGLGLPVHPLKVRDKRPTLSAWPDRASVDPQEVEEMFAGHTGNVGIATGHPLPSGGYLVVIDVDEHDPAASGSEALDELSAQYGALPDTMVVYTPSDGRHLYYSTPEPLTNAAGSHLPAGIDIRGLGGYVVAPDSELDAGRYELDVEEHPVAALPAAWLALLDPPTPAPRPVARPISPTWADAPRPSSERPGDAYLAEGIDAYRADLLRDGWTAGKMTTDGEEWTRPGKDPRDGDSARLHHDSGLLVNWSTTLAELSVERGYDRLGYLAAMHHAGSIEDAVEALRGRGYGTPTSSSSPAEVVYEAIDAGTEWETPIDLDDTDRPEFPLDVLPAAIADQCRQAAVEMQLAPDLAAQLALTALSVVTAGRVYVKVDGRHREPCHLYNVTALPPSAGKSPTFSMMLGPLDLWEEELVEASAELIDDRNIARKMAEKERDDAIKTGDASRAKAAADSLRDMPAIVTPRLMADDATPEKLVELLDQQGGRMALVSTEGGLFGMMTGRYSDKSNLDVYLGAWSGDTIRVDRIERGSTIVRRPALTVGLTVQPSVLAEVGKNRELVGRGLTTRFMYALPSDTVGRRDLLRDSTYSDTVEAAYGRQVLAVADRLRGLPDGDTMLLEFTAEARQVFKRWQARREVELGPYSPLRYMAEWVGKCNSSTARLAGLLHLTSGDLGQHIDEHTVEAAIRVGDYWTAHARAVFDMMGASDTLGHARYILGWMQSTDHGEELTFRDIQQHAKRRVGTVEDIIPAVELLVEHGWLRPAFDGPIGAHVGRGKTSPTFHLHPSITSPMLPHIPHSTDDSDQTTTDGATVGDMGDMGHRDPRQNTYPQKTPPEALDAEEARNPVPTSPTTVEVEHADAGLLAVVDGLAGPARDVCPF